MRGYYGIGVEGVSKAMNVGNLFRSAHAFGASFAFTVAASYNEAEGGRADTSGASGQVPFYRFDDVESMRLPDDCALVGIEILDGSVDLPSFRHPRRAAYVLGMERGGLSGEMIRKCDHLVKIPTKFSLNLATAGAVVMYDRLMSMQQFGRRPVVPGGPIEQPLEHAFGEPSFLKKRKAKTTECGERAADEHEQEIC